MPGLYGNGQKVAFAKGSILACKIGEGEGIGEGEKKRRLREISRTKKYVML
jgi:hypothetical protein